MWPVSGPGRPRNFSVPQTPQKPVNRELLPHEAAEPSKVVVVRKLHNAVPVSQNNVENSPVAASYGRNGFLLVGSLTDKPGPQPTQWPQAPSRAPVSRAPGAHGTPNRVHWVRISHLVGRRFAQNGPHDRENPLFGVFGPFRALNGAREISLSPPDPPKTIKS